MSNRLLRNMLPWFSTRTLFCVDNTCLVSKLLIRESLLLFALNINYPWTYSHELSRYAKNWEHSESIKQIYFKNIQIVEYKKQKPQQNTVIVIIVKKLKKNQWSWNTYVKDRYGGKQPNTGNIY